MARQERFSSAFIISMLRPQERSLQSSHHFSSNTASGICTANCDIIEFFICSERVTSLKIAALILLLQYYLRVSVNDPIISAANVIVCWVTFKQLIAPPAT
ncbi:hypothetical protein Tcan_01138, partial [Toxocara canis]